MASTDPETLARELAGTPGVAELRAAAATVPAYLVGGAVRDLLSGRARGELDVVVETEIADLVDRLGGVEGVNINERFGTASLELGGVRVDLARARAESYAAPGALPQVEPASLDADLARRDFTVNAMAIPLHEAPRVIDPYDGLADLGAGLLRVLHDGSLSDDPTRVLRAARYVARLGMSLEQGTRELAAAADLGTVSADRVNAELARLAVEPNPERGFELLAELGLAGVAPESVGLVSAVSERLGDPAWSALVDAGRAIVAAARGRGADSAGQLAAERVDSPSGAVERVAGIEPEQLVMARAMGADWLDRWLREWRLVRLEISGEDLVAAGVPEGPQIGKGLAAALGAKLDGQIDGREAELEIALRAANADAADR